MYRGKIKTENDAVPAALQETVIYLFIYLFIYYYFLLLFFLGGEWGRGGAIIIHGWLNGYLVLKGKRRKDSRKRKSLPDSLLYIRRKSFVYLFVCFNQCHCVCFIFNAPVEDRKDVLEDTLF